MENMFILKKSFYISSFGMFLIGTISIISFLELTASAEESPIEGSRIFVDAIVASIDGKPITLKDLSKRISRDLTLKEASTDPEARGVLDEMIAERLIAEEAEAKRMVVSPEELDQYIEEVAKRNGLDRGGFEEALKAEHKSLEEYKERIRNDILRSKLASNYVRGSGAVTDREILEYAKAHSLVPGAGGATITLRQMIFDSEKRPLAETKARVNEVLEKLDDGEDFDDLAREYSDSSDAKEGGLLGEVHAKDLSTEIYEAISSLEIGEWSKPIKGEAGYRIFFVDNRHEPDKDEEQPLSDDTKKNIRKLLEQDKVQAKMASYLNEELYKNHSVDKKI